MLAKNQDAALISFMEGIRHSKSARFILTTREHILKKALSVSERINKSPILNHRCVIELSDYSFGQKARILYNHLYFSDLPISYKRAILSGDFYLSIIRHQNFNPRIIEWLAGYVRVRQVQADQYQDHIQKILDSPEEIWLHAFEEQISDAARNVLFALYDEFLGKNIPDLEIAWQPLHRHTSTKYNFPTSAHDFRRALSDLEGSFIKIDEQDVDYSNPSIRDFIENVFANNRHHVVDVIVSATSFRQIIELRDLWHERQSKELKNAFEVTPDVIVALKRVAKTPHVRWKTDPDGRQSAMVFDIGLEKRISTLVSWAEERKSKDLLRIATLVLDDLAQTWKTQAVDFSSVISLLRTFEESQWAMEYESGAMHRRALNGVLMDLNFANYYAWKLLLKYRRTSSFLLHDDIAALDEALAEYQQRGVDEELKQCESYAELKELKDGLVEMQKDNKISFKRAIRRIDKEITKRGGPEDEEEDFQIKKPAPEHDPKNESEVRRLFSSLLD